MTNEVKPGDCLVVNFYYFMTDFIDRDYLDVVFDEITDLISLNINEKLIVLEVIPFNEKTTYLKILRCKTNEIGYTTYSSVFLRKLI